MILRSLDGVYAIADAEHGIEYRISGVRRDLFAGLVGELSVSAGILGTRNIDGPLCSGTIKLSDPRDRDHWAQRCGRFARTNGKLDWGAQLEHVCTLVIAAEQEGHTPAVILRHVTPKPAAPMYDVLGLRLPREHPACLFGTGGGLKSYLAMMIATEQARQGIRVGYFDWELDQDDHYHRQRRIDPAMPDVFYIKCDKPLVYDVDRLRRICRAEGLEYGWFDSAAFGTDGKPEDAVSAMAYMRSLRQLGIGPCVIAHSRREDGDQQPFGSVFWFNSFRACWNLKRASTSPDGETVTLGAFPRKFNLGAHPLAVGIQVQFDGDRVTFTGTDVAGIDELAGSVPLWQRMRDRLRSGPCTIPDLADALDAKPEAIKKAAQRGTKLFVKLEGGHGIPPRLALVDRRPA